MEILKVENLCKSFDDIKAVNNFNMIVNKGDIIGILGPNGAGKSTVISIISTLLNQDKGRVFYKNKDIRDKTSTVRNEIGLVPQDIALYTELTGYENLKFWGSIYGLGSKLLKERIKEVSEIIEISTRLKDKVKNYSGGMKRRMNIGAALLHNPNLIIMDEPTVGIDPQSRKHILDTVLKLSKDGKTIIYTSHYMEEIEYICNKIYIMDEGKVIAKGTKKELIGEKYSSLESVFLSLTGKALRD